MIENKSVMSHIRVLFTYFIVVSAGVICFFPLWNMVCLSFSSSAAITADKVTIFPVDFHLESFAAILEDMQFWSSFFLSVKRVAIGWGINIVVMVLTAFPLTRTEEEFRGRNIYMGLLIFAMLFNGGMVPTYLVVKNLGMINTIWALVLPSAIPIFNVIMVKNFFLSIPASLEEAAKMDGATPLQVLMRVYVPCSKPVLATVSLFSIVSHWNDYLSGLIYMTKVKHYPLMTYIQGISVDLQQLVEDGATADELEQAAQVNNMGLNAAKIVVAVIPLLMIYPLLQKYLITGITIGAVKE